MPEDLLTNDRPVVATSGPPLAATGGATIGLPLVIRAEIETAVEGVVGPLRDELARARERAERAERQVVVLRAKLMAARLAGEMVRAEMAGLRERLDRAPRRGWWPWGRKFVWAGVVWAIACGPALAASDFTGSALLEICRGGERLTYCLGYIRGVAESLDLREGAGLCMPSEVTEDGMRDVVIRYLVANPQVQQDPAVELTRLALITAFPCRQ